MQRVSRFKADGHSHSAGIAKGVDFQPARRAKASLLKEGNFLAAKALDYMVCGVLRDSVVKDSGPKIKQYCNHCNWHVVATCEHVFWSCPGNDCIDDPHIAKSSWTAEHALRQIKEFPCLRIRGIVPKEWHASTNTVDYLSAQVWMSDNFVRVLSERSAYSDGSGGPQGIPRSIAQVGFGAACFKIQG